MGWKSVALASCLVPVLAGCGSVRDLTTETGLARTQRCIEHDARKDARTAWLSVRGQHPRRAFTSEFRDGFLDGYAESVEHGGAAEAPAVPPVSYVRYRKYFGPDGHCLVRDYYLGFQYGTEVAAVAGRCQHFTVPVLPDGSSGTESPTFPPSDPSAVPMKMPGSDSDPLPPPRPLPGGNKFGDPKKSDDPPLLSPGSRPPLPTSPGPKVGDGKPRPVPPMSKPELPVIKPFNPDLSGGGKFAPIPVPRDPDLLPVPNPPLPIPNSRPEPIPVPPSESKSTIPPSLEPLPVQIPAFKLALPAPPNAVPMLPASVPTPSILDDIPVIPFRPTPAGDVFPWK